MMFSEGDHAVTAGSPHVEQIEELLQTEDHKGQDDPKEEDGFGGDQGGANEHP